MADRLITHPDQVNLDWLEDVLRHNGYLISGHIASLSTTVTQPFGSITVWIKVTYTGDAPPDLPATFLLKMDGPGSLAENREIEFYDHYAAQQPHGITVPCFDTAYDAGQRAYHLLLADVTSTHYVVEREAPPTRVESERMMDTLAAFHAFWWGKVDDQTPLVDTNLLNAPADFFGGFVDFMGDRLTAERRSIYERILAALPALLYERLANRANQTLAHDDAHTWNFMQPRASGHALLIDWQQWGISLGVHDVAYLITLFWYPDHRQRQEKLMLQRYHARLLEHGVNDYAWEDCWQDYRLYTLRNMLVPLWAWQMGHWAPHRWVQMEKSMFAFHDLDCSDLLA